MFVNLPVDQGFEHGPARSFAPNPPAYHPRYQFSLGCEAFEILRTATGVGAILNTNSNRHDLRSVVYAAVDAKKSCILPAIH
jgi:hypothetical protein